MKNVDEMRNIIMDYYNEDYINSICNGFINENIFKKERIDLLVEGIKTYQYGFYGAENSLFAVQMNGMIREIYIMNYLEFINMHGKKRMKLNPLLICNFVEMIVRKLCLWR